MDDFVSERLPEHKELDNEISILHGKLAKNLNEEERELLGRLVDTMNAESNCFGIENLIRGYRLGVLMTTEIYQEQDQYQYQEGQK